MAHMQEAVDIRVTINGLPAEQFLADVSEALGTPYHERTLCSSVHPHAEVAGVLNVYACRLRSGHVGPHLTGGVLHHQLSWT